MTKKPRSTSRVLLAISLVSSLAAIGTLGCGASSQEGSGAATPPPAPQPDPLAEPEDVVENESYLDILSDPPTDVLLDGKPIGKTPLKNVKTTPGNHDVTFIDDAEGNRTMGVTIQPGDHETVKLDRIPSIKEQPQ